MKPAVRPAAAVLAFGLFAAACTSIFGPPPETPAPGHSPTPTQGRAPTSPGSAAPVLRKFCPRIPLGLSAHLPPGGPTPPAIKQVENQVQKVRGLKLKHKVQITPVTPPELLRLLNAQGDPFPKSYEAAQSRAWGTIGAIPQGSSLAKLQKKVTSTNVVGVYVPGTNHLVFDGSTNPDPLQALTLAHELTHAVDDQYFNLSKIGPLINHCQGDAVRAAQGATEGSATYFADRVAAKYYGQSYQLALTQQFEQGLQVRIKGIPPFVSESQFWPYKAGFDFMTALAGRGGRKLVDQALAHFPVSTEQIMHPELYPQDKPIPVDVPDLAPTLGPGWKDLFVEQIGEDWLNRLLALRLDANTATDAAAGWGGSIYRAWANGKHTAVVMRTIWDTDTDAFQFADAMKQWIAKGKGQQALVTSGGSEVDVLFATDAGTLKALRSAMFSG